MTQVELELNQVALKPNASELCISKKLNKSGIIWAQFEGIRFFLVACRKFSFTSSSFLTDLKEILPRNPNFI